MSPVCGNLNVAKMFECLNVANNSTAFAYQIKMQCEFVRRKPGNFHILHITADSPLVRDGGTRKIVSHYSAGERLNAPVSDQPGMNLVLWNLLVVQYVANAGQNVTVLLG